MKTYTQNEIDTMITNLKKEQQNKFRRFVVFVVIFCLILSGITGVASYTLAAGQVGYTAKDTSWTVDNTQDAIDELRDTVGYALVGSIFSYMGNNAPFGYLACDGTEYNIADYPRLAEHFTSEFGSANYFGGDGSTTFAVPDLRGEFLRGTGKTGENVGVHQSDGLPDITGNFLTGGLGSFMSGDGAFTYLGEVGRNVTAGSESRGGKLSFAASKSNSIYGSATEVRPKNTSVLYIIKY